MRRCNSGDMGPPPTWLSFMLALSLDRSRGLTLGPAFCALILLAVWGSFEGNVDACWLRPPVLAAVFAEVTRELCLPWRATADW